jgi:hypothetical protein
MDLLLGLGLGTRQLLSGNGYSALERTHCHVQLFAFRS